MQTEFIGIEERKSDLHKVGTIERQSNLKWKTYQSNSNRKFPIKFVHDLLRTLFLLLSFKAKVNKIQSIASILLDGQKRKPKLSI